MNLSKPASSEEEGEKKGGERFLIFITPSQPRTLHQSKINSSTYDPASLVTTDTMLSVGRWKRRCCETRIHAETSNTTVVTQRPECTFKPLTLLLSSKDQNTRSNLSHYCCHPKTRIHAETSNITVDTQRPEYTFKPLTLLLSHKDQNTR